MPRPPCERCGLTPRLPRERYCAPCREEVLEGLERTGYLEPRPAGRERRRTTRKRRRRP